MLEAPSTAEICITHIRLVSALVRILFYVEVPHQVHECGRQCMLYSNGNSLCALRGGRACSKRAGLTPRTASRVWIQIAHATANRCRFNFHSLLLWIITGASGSRARSHRGKLAANKQRDVAHNGASIPGPVLERLSCSRCHGPQDAAQTPQHGRDLLESLLAILQLGQFSLERARSSLLLLS